MIESYRVSSPSSVGWPPRSRTLSSPSQRRSRLRCNGCQLDASERRRGCAFDTNVDEGARDAGPGEVDGRVPPRAPAQERGVRAARAFDEHLLDAADPLAVPRERNALDDIHEPLDASLLDVSRDLVPGHGCFGPLARRVHKRERALVAHLVDHFERLLEVALGLAGEADDDVGRQREVGDAGPEVVHETQVALAAVRAPHRLQDARRARLERKMRVLADGLALGHRGDHVPPEVLRVRAREADALDSVDRVDRAQELGEAAPEVAAVRVDVLPEERDLANAFAGQARDLGEDLSGAAADLAAAHRRHDAVRAHRVAAHRDLYPGLEPALAMHRQRPGELALVGDPEPAARRLAPGAEPLGQVRDRA